MKPMLLLVIGKIKGYIFGILLDIYPNSKSKKFGKKIEKMLDRMIYIVVYR
jgi:hypothetical protein